VDENVETFLQIDGYQGYNRVTKPTRKSSDPIWGSAYCPTHTRRKLKEVFDRTSGARQTLTMRPCKPANEKSPR